MPLVSICIPTYNYARFVGRAIESALAQTHRELEVVVLDDASTDDTPAVVEGFTSDPRVRFERHETNLGLFGNFNRCLEVARGEYVKVLCADDWLHPRCVEDAVALLESAPGAGMAACAGWLVDVEGRLVGMRRAPFGELEQLVPGPSAIGVHADWGDAAGMPSQVLLRRTVVDDVGGFEEEVAPASDMHLWLKVLAQHDLAWTPEPRCYLRIHGRHEHEYAYEASESVFRLWEDLARREPRAVDGAMLRRALRREAHHHLLYVSAYLLRLRWRPAARLLRAIRRHVALAPAIATFALTAPLLAWQQGLRVFALATGRLVMYDPSPRPGPRTRCLPQSGA